MRVVRRVSIVSLLLCAVGCTDDTPIGQPCEFTTLPCTTDGTCGFLPNAWYVESANSQCPTKLCMVYHLADDGSDAGPKNPAIVCDAAQQPSGCVTAAQVEQAMYCTCQCRGQAAPNTELCTCDEGFDCTPAVGTGAVSYCVRRPS